MLQGDMAPATREPDCDLSASSHGGKSRQSHFRRQIPGAGLLRAVKQHLKGSQHPMDEPSQHMDLSMSYVLFKIETDLTGAGNSLGTLFDATHANPDSWRKLNLTVSVTTCGIRATWQEAYYRGESTTSGPLIRTEPATAPSESAQKPIWIDHTWAEKIWAKIENTPGPFLGNMKTALPETYYEANMGDSPTQAPAIELYLAATNADALAHIRPESHPFEMGQNCSETTGAQRCNASRTDLGRCPIHFGLSANNCSLVDVTVYQSGWGYNGREPTVLASFVALGCYCLMVPPHATSAWFRPILSRAWSSPANLFSLALHSQKPAYLGNISVGIKKRATFREPGGGAC